MKTPRFQPPLLLRSALVAAVLGAAACKGTLVTPTPKASTTTAARASATPAVAVGVITGLVRGPAGIVSNNGGSIISDQGGTFISRPKYALTGLAETPVAGVEVFLADARGYPVPGTPTATTDAKGKYTLSGVAPGFPYVVSARVLTATKQEAVLRNLVKLVETTANADLTAASTLVAVATVESQSGSIGTFNPDTFKKAVDATAARLTDTNLPDLADRAAIITFMAGLAKEVAELRAELDELRHDVSALQTRLDDVVADLEKLKHPSPTPEATNTPGASPTPKATPAPGNVSTLAGTGSVGALDGPAATATFNEVRGLAIDASDPAHPRLLIADRENNRLREIDLADPTLAVRTLAGTGERGFADGPATTATFAQPTDIAVDAKGQVYVTDINNSAIRKLVRAADGSATVTTLAGGVLGYKDGTGRAAQFRNPWGLAVDGAGTIYVADTYNHMIRMVTPAGVVTTLAGVATPGRLDGPGATARFNLPEDVAVDPAGNIYVADDLNACIRVISPLHEVTTIVGSGVPGSNDGPGLVAKLNAPHGLAIDATGRTLYVVEQLNHRIRKVDLADPAHAVSTYAGDGTPGFVDGPRLQARFSEPLGAAIDADGKLYVSDRKNQRIRRIDP
ncbi:MAG: repeat containing protein [Cyanobacteria bacterium RYN_339]|nr:repeat containing protein [Cyanobacteria bacterium RYN_339]